MTTMRPPHVPETPRRCCVKPISELLEARAGTHFEDRRDDAMIWLFLDSGKRCGELAGLRVEDVDTGYDTSDPGSRRAFDHTIFHDDALCRLVGKGGGTAR